MSGLFGGGSAPAPVAPTPLPVPKVTRMPTETDPNVLAAVMRTRFAAARRSGRMSTILTDNNDSMMGSSGKTLGA